MNNPPLRLALAVVIFGVVTLNLSALTPAGGTQIMAAALSAAGSITHYGGSGSGHPTPVQGHIGTPSGPGATLATSTLSKSCPKGRAYDDGCPGAPVGGIENAHLLDGYAARAQWNVAGVDYPVGVPASTTLTDWTTFSHAGCSVENDDTHHWIRCDNQTGLVINGVDFTTNGGGMLYLNNDASTTIENSKFGGANLANMSYVIQMAGTSAGLTVTDNYLDTGGSSAFISAFCGGITFEYNYMIHQQQHVIEVGTNSGTCETDIAYKYNFIDDAAIVGQSHMNYQQLQSHTIDSDVEFNTSQELSPKGAEGYQFYCVGTCTLQSPIASYNTMIAKPNGGVTMSYMIHGSAGSSNTTLAGTGTAENNYMDITGAYGAFYPGSFTGWTLSNNTNMTDGTQFSNNP